jgi:hypothetical protein
MLKLRQINLTSLWAVKSPETACSSWKTLFHFQINKWKKRLKRVFLLLRLLKNLDHLYWRVVEGRVKLRKLAGEKGIEIY